MKNIVHDDNIVDEAHLVHEDNIVEEAHLAPPNIKRKLALIHIENTLSQEIAYMENWTYVHGHKPNISEHNSFIITLQNPVTSLDKVATKGFEEAISSDLDTKACQLYSKKWTMNHIDDRNYAFYTRDLFLQQRSAKKEIFVLRSDYFTNDWSTIKTRLGVNLTQQYNQANDYTSEDKISQEGLNNICRLICSEIQIYIDLLDRAENLNEKDKIDSLNDLEKTCPMLDATKIDCVSTISPLAEVLVKNKSLLNYSLSTRNIAFIHIGKAGGSTAGSMIRKRWAFKKKCERFISQNQDRIIPHETQISHQVQEYFHSPRRPKVDKYNSFIVTVRNPIYRLISWYLHRHPENEITAGAGGSLFLCYREANDFATTGLSSIPSSNNETEQCQTLALRFIKDNLMYNFYTKELVEKIDKEIIIIRAEFFWDDWQSANTMLGGGDVVKVDSITHYECTTPVITNRTISSAGINNLCYHLCSDIQIYKKLLLRAVNLNDTHKMISMQELKKTCPIEATTSTCPLLPTSR